jgi:hypothetical protein
MTARHRYLQKRLDTTLRALTQIECIANAALDKHQGNSDVHWILDGVADLAHYALEVAGDPPRPGETAEQDPAAEESPLGAPGGEGGEPEDDLHRRNH